MQSEFMAEMSGNTEHKLALNVFSGAVVIYNTGKMTKTWPPV